MYLYINSNDLDLHLEKKRTYIGVKDFGVVGILDAVFLLYSVFGTEIQGPEELRVCVKTVFIILAIVNLAWVGYCGYRKWRDDYTKEMLLRDIEALDMREHRSSIIAITSSDNPRKYLVYYDPEWRYLVFPNYKTREYENEKNIVEKLSRDLAIDVANIEVTFRESGQERKYATKHNEERTYEYYFYEGRISSIDNQNFEIDGRRYQWMTVQEMLNDKETREHNSFIVNCVDDII